MYNNSNTINTINSIGCMEIKNFIPQGLYIVLNKFNFTTNINFIINTELNLQVCRITELNYDVLKYLVNFNTIHINFNMHKYTDLFNNLPSNITYIDIDTDIECNLSINNLPPLLIYLQLYNKFNNPIDYLPNSLQYLFCGNNFNQSIDNLPSNLEVLYLKDKFNHSIDNLNDNIKILYINSCAFSHSINKLPKKIKILILHIYHLYKLNYNCFTELSDLCEVSLNSCADLDYSKIQWCDSVKILKVHNVKTCYTNLPKYLEELHINMELKLDLDPELDLDMNINIINLPLTLKKIIYHTNNYINTKQIILKIKLLQQQYPNIEFIHT